MNFAFRILLLNKIYDAVGDSVCRNKKKWWCRIFPDFSRSPVSPRRYQLSELVDWFHRVVRKKSDWGYMRYDMKWDPFLVLRARANELICPSWPIGTFVPDKVERVSGGRDVCRAEGSGSPGMWNG